MFHEVEKVIISYIVLTAVIATPKASQISDCLAAAGINVNLNLIERTFENYSEYIDINFQWQERGEHRLPMAYLKVYSAADVQFAVKCGRRLGLAVVPRAGGHGFLKYAYGQNDNITLVLDLKTLNAISVNQETRLATVGAGALMGQVAYQLWENGNFFLPYGVFASVGISGYTLGGGHSLFSYLYGLISDSVIEMEMVDANGELLTINNSTNENLFWALRGAGITGSFGIVTKFVFQMYPVPYHIVRGSVEYSLERFHEFYVHFQEHIHKSQGNDKPIFYAFVLSGTNVRGTFFDIQNATDAETYGVGRIEQVLDIFPSPDIRSQISVITYAEYLVNYFRVVRGNGYIKANFNITQPSDLIKITSFGIGSEWFKTKHFFVKKLLNTSEIMALQGLLIDLNHLPGVNLVAETFLGKGRDYAKNISAFIHRDTYYHLYVNMLREKEDDPVVSAKLNEFFEKSKEILNHSSSYQNFPNDEMSDFLERYYGANLPRLIDIKTEVDPDGFFNTNPQSIPVRNAEGGSASAFNNAGLRTYLSLFFALVLNFAIHLQAID